MCDRASNVICPHVPEPTPPVGGNVCSDTWGYPISGDVKSGPTCASYQFCSRGTLQPQIHSCGQLHFDPSTGTCNLPENLHPRCRD